MLGFLLVLYFSLVGAVEDCHEYKRNVTVHNSKNQQIMNGSYLLHYDTTEDVASGKMLADCSDIRFKDENGKDLYFYTETKCGNSDTRIQVQIPQMESLENATIQWLFGCRNLGELPDTQLIYNGNYYVLKTTTNYKNWPHMIVPNQLYLKIGNKTGIYAGMVKNHTHEFSGSINMNSASQECGSVVKVKAVPNIHIHNIDKALTKIAFPSDEPVYRDVVLSKNKYLVQFDNETLLIINDTSKYGASVIECKELIGVYPRINNECGKTGGWNNHSHMYITISSASLAERDCDEGSTIVPSAAHTHRINATTNLHSNDLNSIGVILGKIVVENFSMRFGTSYYFFADEVPPLGFELVLDYDGNFLHGDDKYGGKRTALAKGTQHTMTVIDFGSNYPWQNVSVQGTGINIADGNHFDGIPPSLSESTSFLDMNNRSRIVLMVIRRKQEILKVTSISGLIYLKTKVVNCSLDIICNNTKNETVICNGTVYVCKPKQINCSKAEVCKSTKNDTVICNGTRIFCNCSRDVVCKHTSKAVEICDGNYVFCVCSKEIVCNYTNEKSVSCGNKEIICKNDDGGGGDDPKDPSSVFPEWAYIVIAAGSVGGSVLCCILCCVFFVVFLIICCLGFVVAVLLLCCSGGNLGCVGCGGAGCFICGNLCEKIPEQRRLRANSVSRNKTEGEEGTVMTTEGVDIELIEYMNIVIKKEVYAINWDEISLVKNITGGGSNFRLYKAYWENRNTVVAFKQMKLALFSNQEDYHDFEKEALMHIKLSHPNIIRFFGLTIKKPRIGIVMEWCENGDLESYFLGRIQEEREKQNLGRDNPIGYIFPISYKVQILIGIASGMNHLHKKSIVHRDLKPKNIVLTLDDVPKIIDFGLSRVIKESDIDKTMKIGTSQFMAPEMINSRNYTELVDVFSFAILMYAVVEECFWPYGKKSGGEVDIRIANDPDYRPTIPNDTTQMSTQLEKLIRDCWNCESSKRPGFGEILDLLTNEKIEIEKKEFSVDTTKNEEEEEEEPARVETDGSSSDSDKEEEEKLLIESLSEVEREESD